jgi:hypothetical protein
MAFVLPTFNLECNVWHAPHNPHTLPFDDTFECQLRGPNQTSATVNPTPELAAGNYLLLPPGVDIRDQYTLNGSDIIECPVGTGRYYQVLNVDDIAKGFTNEHRYAILTKWGQWPVPIP